MPPSPSPRPAQRRTPRSLFITVLVLLLSASAVVCLRWRTPGLRVKPSDTALVVSRTNLVLVAGHLCLHGQTNAFTGIMIEHAANGLLRSRSEISNGVLQGLSEGWHTNGQLQISEHFRAGASHGLRTKWYASGAKQSEANIAEGKLNGAFRRWHERGALSEQLEFVEGQPHGVSLAYYPSGCLKARVTLDHGKVLDHELWAEGEAPDPLLATAPARSMGTRPHRP
jgi:hypothetical protein